MNLIFQHSFWWLPLMLFISGLVAFFLYYKEKKYSGLGIFKLLLMASLRFLVVFLILMLLFDPLIRKEEKKIEKPLVIFVQDNSSSVALNKDSVFYRDIYKSEVQNLILDLSNQYELVQLNIGKDVRRDSVIDFKDKISNLSDVFPMIEASYGGMNIGAVIYASDGVFNTGRNPLASQSINYPLYTLALGDTSAQKDFYVGDIKHNKLAFYNNNFPVRINLSADKCKDIETKIEIIKDDDIVFEKIVSPDSDEYFEKIDIELLASDVGILEYEINIVSVDGEISVENNTRTFVVDVIDNRQKILLYGNSPHPDIGAIKSVLVDNINFEVDIYYTYSVPQPVVGDYDLIVLHQLPSKTNNPTRIFNEIERLKSSVLFILGEQSSIPAFNQLLSGVELKTSETSFDNALPKRNKSFSAFSLDNDFVEQLSDFPPLKVPFAEYNFTSDADIMLNQTIGRVNTDKPLIAFINRGDSKYGFIMGEGLWRWRLIDYQLNQSYNHFSALVNRTAQFLITQRLKQKLLIDTRRIVSEGENVVFNAELYNEAYELFNDADVEINILNEELEEFSYNMDKIENYYKLNLGSLKSGTYTYAAKAEFDNKTYVDSGELHVRDLNLELLRTRADHAILNSMAVNNSGKMFYPNQLKDLKDAILQNKDIVSKLYVEHKLSNLINIIWLFFIIILLGATEWFLRKFWGAY